MDIVDMQRSGTAVLVQKGNPTGLDLNKLCGHRIGAASGSEQGLNVMPRLQKACEEAGQPSIEVLSFAGPIEGSLAVKSGRIDGWLDGAPYAGYIMVQSGGTFEKAPTADLTGMSGFSFRKGDPMAEVFREAVIALVADGTYQKILANWQIPELALEAPLINGQ